MLITRTEMFTDWVFQGAHAGEQAATVGRGLMRGHIYFRYADDFLKAGETIQREISFVELSDGSTYELGGSVSRVQFSVETLIAANDGNHPALTTGYKLVVANKTGANVIFSNSATLTFTLLTV